MKITVLGATGATGRLVVEQALGREHEVVAYVRRSDGSEGHPGLRVVVGELTNTDLLSAAITDADAVICCLGTHERKNVDLMQQSLPLIVQAMKHAGRKRLVLMSAYGVGETARTASLVPRIAYKTLVASVYQDKERSEAALPQSGLDLTRIYPVVLTDDSLSESVEVRPMPMVTKVKGLPKVSRANVAKAILDAAEDRRTIGQKLLVTSRGSVV
ncbi:MAG TPA: NAD(P)-binding oxidoreductase [Caulobacteraceae bacterium]